MADTLTTSISVQYVEEDIQKTTRFMDETISHEPVSYEEGQANLTGGVTNHELATGINMINLIVQDGASITVKIGDTTAPSLTNIKSFMYDGDTTNLFVSNPRVDSVKIRFVSGKF